MKALLILIAVTSTAYVGYSYSATDGESCLVCPMTGESVFASTEAEPEAGTCCPGCAAKAMLTSVTAEECHGNCEKDCCKDKEATADQDAGGTEEEVEEVVAEATEAE